ncbi:MAG TPA: DUF5678 domain-containing protein [Candidatus Bathyarchaeia archaeon]|nr:DUF5678 domain-containing protein [Candidatus Bathyarchaeia archaeon]
MSLLVEKSRLTSATERVSFERRQNLRADYRWISTEKKKLLKKYLNKYVAVKNGEVVLADSDVYNLVSELREKGVEVDSVAVEFVSKHPCCFLL